MISFSGLKQRPNKKSEHSFELKTLVIQRPHVTHIHALVSPLVKVVMFGFRAFSSNKD